MLKAFITALFLTSSLTTHAHNHAMKACKPDVEKLCKEAKGKKARMHCLKEKHSELSEECKAAIEEKKEAFKESMAACKDDVETLCKDVEGGHGRMMKCLHDNKEKLSEGCKAQFKSMKESHGKK